MRSCRTAARLGGRALPYLLLFQVLLPILACAVDVFARFGLIVGDAARMGLIRLGLLAVQIVRSP